MFILKRLSYSGIKYSIKTMFAIEIKLGLALLANALKRITHQSNEKQHYYYKLKHEIIEKWLLNKYGHLIPNKIDVPNCSNHSTKAPIWVLWWQGESNMLPIIKACYNSICEHAGAHPVVLLTKYNYAKYVDIPEYIIYKVNNGIITLTQLSDIIRICLLYKHGGLWLDITLYLTKDIPECYFGTNFNSVRIEQNENWSVTEYRWAIFMISTNRGNPIFKILKDLLLEYNKNETQYVDYLLIDYMIDILYKNIHEFKILIDDIPYSNPEIYTLYEIINDEYDEALFNKIKETTNIFKLSYKNTFYLRTKECKKTFYAKIISK